MSEEILVVPLLQPAEGTPPVIDTESKFKDALTQLAQGHGPFAVDAERASGFRYSARAYLIQIKRNNGGLHLIDPIPFGPGHNLFNELNALLNTDEVILHASTQDLPCLRELGINPFHLFDTELAGRIAGLLDKSNKLSWALEEFASILKAPPAPPRVDPWRRTSGMHKIKRRDQLAIIKELWIARDRVASEQDIAPGKLLNDGAIVELAIAASVTKKEFEKALRPLGLRARWLENLPLWLSSISAAVALPEDQWPAMRTNADTLPPIKLWRDKFPEKYAPLSHARAAIELIAQENEIPVENLITPEHVRRVCWKPPAGATETLSIPAVEQALFELGARQWQINLVGPALASALLERDPLPVPEVAVAEVRETTPEEG